MARRAFTTHPLVVRRVEVRGVREVTPRMRRITVSGSRLDAFDHDGIRHPPFTAPGFDDHLKLIFATDGDVARALPEQLPSGIEWHASDTRIARDYTPRAVRHTVAGIEIDLDFVRHGDGPAARWASSAVVGDDLWFVGPKSSTVLPDELDWILLAGDETALPAIGRFLDERPIDVPARIVVTVADPAAVQDLALGPSDRIEWVHGPSGALEPAVRAILADAVGTGYVWAGSESAALLPLRRYVQRELGLPKSHTSITGYWFVDDAPPASGAPEPATPHVAHPVSPLGWFAVRGALQLGLLDRLAATPGLAAPELAARAGVPPHALGPLLRLLRTIGVLAGDDDDVTLGPLGDLLVDDEHEREQFVGLEADAVLALERLAPALRSGISPWRARTGATLAEQSGADAELFAELAEEADSLSYLLHGVVSDRGWTDVRRTVVTGPGAVVTADALRAQHPHLRADVRPSGLGESAVDIPAEPAVDLVVGALALGHCTDREAGEVLRRMRTLSGRALLLESSRPDALSPHADEEALLTVARTGSAPRGAAALGALARTEGWVVDRVVALGWGVEATWLRSEKHGSLEP